MPKRDNDITCQCNAYSHPHRLGGGKCDGSAWCESIRSIDSYHCECCNKNDNGQCQVITGQEDINDECECVDTELRTRALKDEYGNLPLDIENYMERKYRDHCDQ